MSCALVTGAASGLGRATAERFLAAGHKVILCDVIDAAHDHYDARYVRCDVTSPSDVTKALDKADEFGGVNVVVNCAGIGLARKVVSSRGPHDLEAFSKVLRVNTEGTFNVIRLAADRMKSRGGVIVNTASIAAYDGQIGQAAYAASKGAIVAMTLPLARDLASFGIRVVTIAPGLFNSPLLRALPAHVQDTLSLSVPCPNRLGEPHEFAHLVQAVVDNPMLNGEVIRLDGALRMPPSN